MSSPEMPISALYDWCCRVEDEIADLKSSFPEALAGERNRVVLSLRMLRVSLEVRVQPKMIKRPPARGTRGGPQDAARRTTPYQVE